ncbi:hypothetical protein D3C75_1265630 [compost metagenome]
MHKYGCVGSPAIPIQGEPRADGFGERRPNLLVIVKKISLLVTKTAATFKSFFWAVEAQNHGVMPISSRIDLYSQVVHVVITCI